MTPSETPETDAGDAGLPRSLRLARLLDAKYRLPGTRFRFGIDPLLGFLPVIGDSVSLAIGLIIVYDARRLGVRRTVLVRMLVNLGADWLIGSVPLLGNVLDFFMKPNRANARMLAEEHEAGRLCPRRWWWR